jgi:hypothetical protein
MSLPDLLKLALEIAAAEEAARGLAVPPPAPQQPPRPQAPEAPSARVVRLRSVRLPSVLVDERGPGRLHELVVVSPTDGFALKVVADGRVLFDDPYPWFESVSPLLEGVDAFSLDGSYAVRISGIEFRERLTVEAYPTAVAPLAAGPQPATLSEVFCKLSVPA